MNDENKTKWQLTRGDGNSRPMPADKFTALKEEFEQMATDAGKSCNDRRELAEDTLYCRWAGQSPDGRKHAEALDGEKPFPFEGASDARVRTADGIGQEQVIVLMASLMRMQLGVKGTEATDMELAADVNVLWRWLEKNQLGAEWFVENTKLAQYRQNDSPAVGIMQVWWDEQKALKPVDITPELVVETALKDAAARGAQVTPEQAADLQDMLVNVARTDELAGLLLSLWPELPEASAKTAAGELQEAGTTTIAYPYTCENRLRVKARRLFDDIFVPENTSDLQRARVIFVREWFTEPELREKDAKGEFKAGFLEAVLKHEGASGWKHFAHMTVAGDYSEATVERTWDKESQRGQYEIITAFFRASNKLGIPGIYTVVYHHEVEDPGSDMELFNSPKGRYPFFANPREIRTDKLWETRGLSELSATEQAALKQLHDSFMDHVQLVTIPPVEVPANRPKMALVWQPLSQIKTMRSGEIRPIVLGQYPVANDKVTMNIDARLARYFGLMTASNTPDWVRLYQNFLTDSYFVHIAEVVRYGLALAWEYLPDETLARVLGHQIPHDQDQMEYDVQIAFEAGMLNLDFLKTVGEMISSYVLQWDTQSTVQRDKLVRWFFSALSPTLAQELLVPAEQANQREVEDEQKCFTMIAAGIEPPMVTQGQNYQLRLQTEMQIGKSNPEAWDKLTPKSHEILEARLKFLEQQVTQQQNAQIGRTGVRPALAPASAADAVAGG
jgi:hypothetical protein